jgi:predicted transcriptional regulator
MPTTIEISDELARVAGKLAAGRGESLSCLMERALRRYLETAAAEDEPFILLEAGTPGGRYPTPAEVQQLLNEEGVP